MRKSLLLLSVLILVLGITAAASANLITNPGFEDDPILAGWDASGGAMAITSETWAHTGLRAGIINDQGALNQNINLSDAPSHVFGGYVRIWTDDWVGNWDQVQATLWAHIPAKGETFRTDPGNIGSKIFSEVSQSDGGGYISDWIYFEKELLTPGFGGYAAVLNLNIKTSGNGIPALAAFDDVFVRAVPEPSSLLILFTGIIGIALARQVKG